MSISTYNAYSEQFLFNVLQKSDTSLEKTEAIAKLVIRHLPKVEESWSAIRKCLAEQVDLHSETNHAIWNLIDILLKSVPHIFVPLVSPRIHEYAVHYLPWDQVRWVATGDGEKRAWCEVMVHSWQSVLSREVFLPIQQHALQCRSEADLNGALFARTDNAVEEEKEAPAAAVQQLMEDWDSLRYFCASLISKKKSEDTLHILSSEGGDPSKKREEASGDDVRPVVSSTTDTVEEDQEDYTPSFVADAPRKVLPKIDVKPKRKARRREREDDDL